MRGGGARARDDASAGRCASGRTLDRRKLPHRQRAALVLRFYEDLPEREIARALGCRAGTVKSLVLRGLASMREEMGGADR
jgi:DNA-directed RNA polymerase specialized sigma24 family protein